MARKTSAEWRKKFKQTLILAFGYSCNHIFVEKYILLQRRLEFEKFRKIWEFGNCTKFCLYALFGAPFFHFNPTVAPSLCRDPHDTNSLAKSRAAQIFIQPEASAVMFCWRWIVSFWFEKSSLHPCLIRDITDDEFHTNILAAMKKTKDNVIFTCFLTWLSPPTLLLEVLSFGVGRGVISTDCVK